MDGMDALFSNPDFSDVTFVVKEERFHVHKIILATRSEYFRYTTFLFFEKNNIISLVQNHAVWRAEGKYSS